MAENRRQKWRTCLFLSAAVAFVAAVGPGVLLVNRPVTVLGIPMLYLWAVLWYGVFSVIALLANKHVWLAEDEKV